MVDDEPDLDILIKQKFRKRIAAEELSFSFARNGREALSKLEAANDIFLVVTDLNMPEVNGIELVMHVRKKSQTLPIIIVSAYSDRESIDAAKAAGANDFLCKPLRLSELEAKIDGFMPH